MNVLVIGGAKTGTTVISRTIHNSMVDAQFHMEPKTVNIFVEPPDTQHQSNVVKIIFEHWNRTPHLRRAIISGELPMSFDKIVLIARDPRDEAISRIMYFIYPWLTRNGLKGNKDKAERWIEFIKLVEKNPADYSFLQMRDKIQEIFATRAMVSRLQGFRTFREFCNTQPKKGVFLLKYEDFISNDRSRLEEYLEFSLSDKSGLDSQDRTKRSATYGNWKTLFKQEDLDYFKEHLGDLMDAQGYDDWELSYAEKLPKKNYSEYIERLVAERRSFERKKAVKNFFR